MCDEEGDRILCELTDRGSYSCSFPRTGPKKIHYSVMNASNTADNAESDKCVCCHLSTGAKQGPRVCVYMHMHHERRCSCGLQWLFYVTSQTNLIEVLMAFSAHFDHKTWKETEQSTDRKTVTMRPVDCIMCMCFQRPLISRISTCELCKYTILFKSLRTF